MKVPFLLPVLALVGSFWVGAAPSAVAAPAPAPHEAAAVDSVPVIINQIMQAVGLEARFVAVPSDDVLSAAAVTIDGRRCIVYNPAFVRAVNLVTHTRWAGVSILAHEIGHHLNGHTLSADARNQAASYRNELEADEFSGFVLRRMGASAEEAVAALTLLTSEKESATHPPRSARIAAVAAGWNGGSKPGIPAAAKAASKPDTAASTAPAVSTIRQRLNPAAIAGRLTFDAVPEHILYLTRNLNLVDDAPNGARVLGSLEPTRNRRYPYRLVQADGQSTLFVTARGLVVNQAGRRVGLLMM